MKDSMQNPAWGCDESIQGKKNSGSNPIQGRKKNLGAKEDSCQKGNSVWTIHSFQLQFKLYQSASQKMLCIFISSQIAPHETVMHQI